MCRCINGLILKHLKHTIASDYISKVLMEEEYAGAKPNTKVVWLGNKPVVEIFTKSKKGNQWEVCLLTFETKKETLEIKTDKEQGLWLAAILEKLSVKNIKTFSLQEVKESYETAGLDDFELFWDNKPVNTLYKAGLLQL